MTDSAVTTPATDDPFESASNATYTDPPIALFGQMYASARYVVFEKGAPKGRREFDPNTDNIDARRTEVTLTLQPVVVGRKQWERAYIAEDREWARLVNPSIKALGLQNAKGLDGKYAEAHLVDSGRWIDPQDKSQGQWKTIKLVRLFDTEDECVQASQARRSGGTTGTTGAQTSTGGGAAPAPAAAPAAIAAPSEAVALKFVGPLWKQSGEDTDKFLALLQSSPMTRGLSIDHPEVMRYLLPADTAGQ